ncbi:MAG: radical SAM protein [bacterium]
MPNNKVMFIQPPFFRLFKDTFSFNGYPFSLGYLAGTVKKETSWEVSAYNSDFNPKSVLGNDNVTFSFQAGEGYTNYINNLADASAPIWNEIRETIGKVSPTVVGISCTSQNFKAVERVAQIAKDIDSSTLVLVGGPHPSMVGSEVLKCGAIDIAARGEGERTILEVLDAVLQKKSFSHIYGIAYRSHGQVIETGPRDLIQDLDSLCFPYDSMEEVLIGYDQYPLNAFGSIFASRGCPFGCTFCGSRKIWGRTVRLRSPGNVVKELARLQKRGFTSVRFADDSFGVNRKWLKELCETIKLKCPDLKWKCEMNVGVINDETLSLMKSAGCHMIELGIESGDNRVLKEIKKGITIEQALVACKLVNKYGIELQAYIMAGFPQETEESLLNTRNAIRKINGYICFNVFSPFPGTELYELCKEKKLIADDYDVCLHSYQNLDSFCISLPRDKFRKIVSEMIREVDRKNKLNRIRRIFSTNTIWRLKEYGLMKGMKKGVRIMFARKSLYP